MKRIFVEDIEQIAIKAAKEIFLTREQIPEFNSRLEGRLESAIEQPFQSFNNQELFTTLEEKAAALMYYINKDHCFQNGNKRISVASMLLFLFLNDLWIKANPDDLYQLALNVARSRKDSKTEIKRITTFIEIHLERI